MSKILLLFSCSAILLLNACALKKAEEDASDIASSLEASKGKVAYGLVTVNDSPSQQCLTLNLLSMPDKNVNRAKATGAAYQIYIKSKPLPEDCKIIDISLQGEHTNYEGFFAIDTLALVEKYMHGTVTTFLSGYKANDARQSFDSIRLAIDAARPDDQITELIKVLHKVSNTTGKLTDMKVDGFYFGDNIRAEPTLVVAIRAENTSRFVNMLFEVSIAKRKIINFEIRPE